MGRSKVLKWICEHGYDGISSPVLLGASFLIPCGGKVRLMMIRRSVPAQDSASKPNAAMLLKAKREQFTMDS